MGKFPDKYHNLRRDLKNAGVIPKTVNKRGKTGEYVISLVRGNVMNESAMIFSDNHLNSCSSSILWKLFTF